MGATKTNFRTAVEAMKAGFFVGHTKLSVRVRWEPDRFLTEEGETWIPTAKMILSHEWKVPEAYFVAVAMGEVETAKTLAGFK